jgi:hypothetical protein
METRVKVESNAPVSPSKPGAVIAFNSGEKHHYAPETFSGSIRKFVFRDDEGSLSPLHSIAQLEVGSVVCHTTKGQGAVVEFSPKLGPRKGTAIDQLAKQIEDDPEDTMILEQLRKWDTDGDGEFSIKEVHAACKHFMNIKRTNSNLKKTMLIGIVVTVSIMAVLVGLMVGSIEATKEAHTESSGEFLTPAGQPVTVRETDIVADIMDIAYLNANSLKAVHELIIDNANPDVEGRQFVIRVSSFTLLEPGVVVVKSQDGVAFKIDAPTGAISINQGQGYIQIFKESSRRRQGLRGRATGATSGSTRFHRHRL